MSDLTTFSLSCCIYCFCSRTFLSCCFSIPLRKNSILLLSSLSTDCERSNEFLIKVWSSSTILFSSYAFSFVVCLRLDFFKWEKSTETDVLMLGSDACISASRSLRQRNFESFSIPISILDLVLVLPYLS